MKELDVSVGKRDMAARDFDRSHPRVAIDNKRIEAVFGIMEAAIDTLRKDLKDVKNTMGEIVDRLEAQEKLVNELSLKVEALETKIKKMKKEAKKNGK